MSGFPALQFQALSKFDVSGIGLNMGEVDDDAGVTSLRVLGVVHDSTAHAAGIRQVRVKGLVSVARCSWVRSRHLTRQSLIHRFMTLILALLLGPFWFQTLCLSLVCYLRPVKAMFDWSGLSLFLSLLRKLTLKRQSLFSYPRAVPKGDCFLMPASLSAAGLS